MRTYTVQSGDSPAKIAAAHAGCPKCAIDLVHANPHKGTISYPNGYISFRDLRAGEQLVLPDKWFSRAFDALPPSYFASLPSADGVTSSTSGGLLGAPYSAGLVSAAQAAAAAMAADVNYCASVRQPGTSVNSAVHAFKAAWNASQTPPVPINTGNYESSVAAALAQVLGGAPTACDVATAAAVVPKVGLSAGAVIGIGLAVAGAIGGAAYLAAQHPPTRKRAQRAYRHAKKKAGHVYRRARRRLGR